MKIGIDASNIRSGGGKKHLINFINTSLEENKNISFFLISNKIIISHFRNTKRVTCITNSLLNSFNFFAFFSQLLYSSRFFKKNNCELVFVPGGIFLGNFRPFYTMSQNMIPFESLQLKTFSNLKRIKFILMKYLQINTFKKSKGVIFLTEYARDKIETYYKVKHKSVIIPHGIKQRKVNSYNLNKNIFNILYVSDFLPYKHNYNVAKAVSELISEGYKINLNLVGRNDKIQNDKILEIINSNDNYKTNINILGELDSIEVENYYSNSSLFLFASTCENLPFIIIEAMSFGLPIISSNKRPMIDILEGEDIFFDSYNIESIKKIILNNMSNQKLIKLSKHNFSSSKKYLWKKNSLSTLNFFKH
jgi:glycosyltransferase involved in cell wall biosynthesis